MHAAAAPTEPRADEAPIRDLLFRLLPAFLDEPRIEAVWVEGEPSGSRPRLAWPLDLHVAVAEPVFGTLAETSFHVAPRSAENSTRTFADWPSVAQRTSNVSPARSASPPSGFTTTSPSAFMSVNRSERSPSARRL